jgi:hypothetical protein
MLLFIVIALILYALYSRPHRRVPSRPIRATLTGSRVPDSGTARAAAVAGGLTTAPGGGTTEMPHEPAGAHVAANEPGGATLAASENPEDTADTQASAQEPDDNKGASE